MRKKLTSRAILVPVGLAALLALALGLWFGAFSQQQAAANPGIDLVITKQASPSEATLVVQGGTITYTLTAQNIGTTAATGVVIEDTLGTGLELVSITGGTGVTCADNTNPYDCTADIGVGASRTVTVVAKVTAASGSTVLNGAYVDPLNAITPEDNEDADDRVTAPDCTPVGEGSDADPDTEADNFDCTAHTVGTTDLTIIKSAVPTEATGVPTGGTIIYTLTVSNSASATGTATGVPVREYFEAALPYEVSVQTVTASAPDSCADTSLPEINCTIATLAPGASRTISVVVVVVASAGATVYEGAYVDPDNIITETNDDAGDPLVCTEVGEGNDPGGATSEPDNFDCTAHGVGTVDLSITKSATPVDGSTVATGATITYALVATNSASATATATNVVIRDYLGTGLTFGSITAGTGVTCSDTTGPTYDCTAASMAPGESRSVTVVATVAATSGAVLNGALVDPSGGFAETNEDAGDPSLECAAVGEGSDAGGATSEPDNFDCTSHAVGGLDLTISKTATPTDGTSVSSGANITYTLSVSATGATANNVLIRDKLGTGLTFVSITGGTGVTCEDTTGPDYDCTASTVVPGTNRTVTVVATVSATSGTVLNGARVDPGSAITEANEDADDPGLDCTAVGEGTDADPITDPDNFDCTSHTVGAAATRTFNLSPAGWHSFVWTGASSTDPATALACLGTNYTIAYQWVGSTTPAAWLRYIPGHPELSTLTAVNKYDALLVYITAAVTCTMAI